MKGLEDNRGSTYIEVVLALCIIGVLMLTSYSYFLHATQNKKATEEIYQSSEKEEILFETIKNILKEQISSQVIVIPSNEVLCWEQDKITNCMQTSLQDRLLSEEVEAFQKEYKCTLRVWRAKQKEGEEGSVSLRETTLQGFKEIAGHQIVPIPRRHVAQEAVTPQWIVETEGEMDYVYIEDENKLLLKEEPFTKGMPCILNIACLEQEKRGTNEDAQRASKLTLHDERQADLMILMPSDLKDVCLDIVKNQGKVIRLFTPFPKRVEAYYIELLIQKSKNHQDQDLIYQNRRIGRFEIQRDK